MPSNRREQWTLITASLIVLAAVAIGFVLWFTRSVMIPFVLAVFVAAVVAPLVDWLELRARFHRWMSVVTVLLLVAGLAAFGVFLLTYTAYEVGQSVDRYTRIVIQLVKAPVEAAGEMVDSKDQSSGEESDADDSLSNESTPTSESSAVETTEVNEPTESSPDEEASGGNDSVSNASTAAEESSPDEAIKTDQITDAAATPSEGATVDEGAEVSIFSVEHVRSWLNSITEDLSSYLSAVAQSVLGSAARVLQTILSTTVLMTIFLLFLLAGRDPEFLKHGVYADIESKIRHYLSIKLTVSAITGLLVATVLIFMRVELALVFGVLTFLLNFIPSVGSIIATLLPLPIASAQFILEPLQAGDDIRPWMVVAVLLGPGAIQMVMGNVVEPRIMGEGLQLHPIVILIALAFWTLLWGPIGAILAVPITAVIRIAISRFVSLQPVTEAMAGRLPE